LTKLGKQLKNYKTSKKRMKTQKIAIALGIATVMAFNFSVQAAEKATSPSLSILKSVPLAELPSKAAALVTAAKADTQIQTAVDVVKAAVGLNPAAATAVVGSIAAGTPEVAPVAAATAASLMPKQASLIAQAAAAAAPKQAGKIVEAVCLVAPDAYKAIAQAVAEAVPGAAKEILAGVASAIPSLKDAINNALAVYKGAAPSVNRVLTQVASAPSPVTLAAGVTPKVGGQGTPYQPRSGTPVNLTPDDGTPVIDRPLNYSAPDPH
jgi:hypothetical protein